VVMGGMIARWRAGFDTARRCIGGSASSKEL
jgi:hypothetical protein